VLRIQVTERGFCLLLIVETAPGPHLVSCSVTEKDYVVSVTNLLTLLNLQGYSVTQLV
jgi:hypothetical protein